MEAFFSTVKIELKEHFDSHQAATGELFEYIEVFYNQRRRHSTLDYVSPAVYERQASQRDEITEATGRSRARGMVPPAPGGDRRSWGIL